MGYFEGSRGERFETQRDCSGKRLESNGVLKVEVQAGVSAGMRVMMMNSLFMLSPNLHHSQPINEHE
jgi:hypothetical protein